MNALNTNFCLLQSFHNHSSYIYVHYTTWFLSNFSQHSLLIHCHDVSLSVTGITLKLLITHFDMHNRIFEITFRFISWAQSWWASFTYTFQHVISSFLSRVSILLLTRDIDIVILSVRLSVCLSVCPSVCPWHAGIVWKRLNVSS